MDVIGSIIGLCQIVAKGVEVAKTLYHAPEELAALQEKVQDFKHLVQQTDSLHVHSDRAIVRNALSKAQATVQQLDQFIKAKLLTSIHGGTERARRRAWGRNKSKVQKFRIAILESKENLVAALSANSSFAIQAHASLSTIWQKIEFSCKSTSAIEEKLDSVLAVTLAIQNETHIVNRLLRYSDGKSGCHPPLQAPQAATNLGTSPSRFLDTGLYDFRALEQEEFMEEEQNSPNFALESYTLNDLLPYRKLQTFYAIEEHSNNFFRVNSYFGFFAKGSQQLCRLFISVVISQSSPYWNCLQVSTVMVQSVQLPESLRKGVELFLSTVENFRDIWHLTIYLEGNTTLGYDACPQSQIPPKQIRSPPCFQDILSRTIWDVQGIVKTTLTKFDICETDKGFMPPEYRHTNCISRGCSRPLRETVDATPRTDIFHLGMTLWLLAEGVPILSKEYLCQKAGCNSTDCREEHTDPIALPELSDEIPQYWEDIIADCRKPDPSQPASLEAVQLSFKTKDIEDLSIFVRDIDVKVVCTFCGVPTSKHVFHCDTCVAGDFDLCPACFEQNRHCYRQDHFLVERKPGRGPQIQTEKFYSRPGPNGREVKIL
ncbi:hypothetical protein V8E51_013969 [Hyaloscypha variabilis]